MHEILVMHILSAENDAHPGYGGSSGELSAADDVWMTLTGTI
jgi:hypothetical protein